MQALRSSGRILVVDTFESNMINLEFYKTVLRGARCNIIHYAKKKMFFIL